MKKVVSRLIYGLLFALPLMLMTYAIANAGSVSSSQAQGVEPPRLSCPTCHQDFDKNFQGSTHQKVAQMNCLSCHNQVPSDHPKEPVPLDKTGQTCATCHATWYYEWQTSGHRDLGMSCTSCHDPHIAGIKAATPVEQCATCHQEMVQDFAHSSHATKGLTCIDCHMPEDKNPNNPINPRHDHSFKVNISTCNKCHSQDVHSAINLIHDNTTDAAAVQTSDALSSAQTLTVSNSPQPVNPLGFATLSGVFGLAAGAILAPWLEHLLRGKKNKQS